MRERYGFMPAFDPKASNRCGAPAWSQRILLARRLVEAGVRLVTVDLRLWDTHVKGFESLKLGFLPRWDRAFTALIEDLEVRFRVRRNKHGRHIVYGTFDYWNEGSSEPTCIKIRVGKYLPSIVDEIEPALREVGEDMRKRVLNDYMHRWVTIALDACFANLGPQLL